MANVLNDKIRIARQSVTAVLVGMAALCAGTILSLHYNVISIKPVDTVMMSIALLVAILAMLGGLLGLYLKAWRVNKQL